MWQRWNQSTHIFEKSTDNGIVWTPLGLNASIITEGTLPDARLSSNVALADKGNAFSVTQSIVGSDARLAVQNGNGIWQTFQASPWGLDLESNIYYNGTTWVSTHGSYANWVVRTSAYQDNFEILRSPPLSVALTQIFGLGGSGKIYERGRAVPMSQRQVWTPTVTTAEGAACPGVGYAYFSVIGDMVFWSMYWGDFTVPAATGYLRFSYPPGYAPTGSYSQEGQMRTYTAGVNKPGYSLNNIGALLVYIQNQSWPAGSLAYALGQGFYNLS